MHAYSSKVNVHDQWGSNRETLAPMLQGGAGGMDVIIASSLGQNCGS